eukprot:768115-Hanusia_phi.AAC.1
MFADSVRAEDAGDLVVSLELNEKEFASGSIINGAAGGPLQCECLAGDGSDCVRVSVLSATCDGCDDASSCTVGACEQFDVDCLDSVDFTDSEVVSDYAAKGTCQCRTAADCPKSVPSCSCPAGLTRSCSKCSLFMYTSDTNEVLTCTDESGCPEDKKEITGPWCPEGFCEEWECSCYNSMDAKGIYGGRVQDNKFTGIATCEEACPRQNEEVVTNSDLQCERELRLACCTEWQWNNDQYQCIGSTTDCNIGKCCTPVMSRVAKGSVSGASQYALLSREESVLETSEEDGKQDGLLLRKRSSQGENSADTLRGLTCNIPESFMYLSISISSKLPPPPGCVDPPSNSTLDIYFEGMETCMDYSADSSVDPNVFKWDIFIAVADTASYIDTKQQVEPAIRRLQVEETCYDVTIVEDSLPHICGDGIKVSATNIPGSYSMLASIKETCDTGSLNGIGSCNDQCACITGFVPSPTSTECVCANEFSYSLKGYETNQVAGEPNTIHLRLNIQNYDTQMDPVLTASQDNPVVVTISGLTGSNTASGLLPVSCAASTPTTCFWASATVFSNCPYLDSCIGIGVQTTTSPWEVGKAEWNQGTGTLKFTLTSDVHYMSPPETEGPYLDLSIELENGQMTQLPPTVTATACAKNGVPPSVQLTSSVGFFTFSQYVVAAGQEAAVSYKSSTGVDITVGRVSVSAILPEGGSTTVAVADETKFGGVTSEAMSRLLQGASLTGMEGKAIKISSSSSVTGIEGSLTMSVDDNARKKAGGCMVTSDNTLNICLRGKTGLYQYDAQSRLWTPDKDVTMSTLYVDTVSTSQLIPGSVLTVISSPQCCILDGTAKPCGERVCLSSAPSKVNATALLGGGVTSRMPSLAVTTRPIVGSKQALDQFFATLATSSDPVATRLGWRQYCPAGSASCTGSVTSSGWIPARFGHATAVTSGSTLLVYGGIGCAATSTINGKTVCSNLTEPLSDLWELDLEKVVLGLSAMRLIELSPALGGMVGMSMVTLGTGSYKVLVVGGSEQSYNSLYLMEQKVSPYTTGKLVISEVEYNAGTTVQSSISTSYEMT